MINKLRNTYYSIRYGISNIIRWFPVVWNDRWYDFEGTFYKFLSKKLAIMLDEKNEYHCLHEERIKKRMRVIKHLAERLYNADYFDDELERYYPVTEDLDSWLYRLTNATEVEKKARRRYLDKVNRAEREDREMLFRYLQKYYRTFWD